MTAFEQSLDQQTSESPTEQATDSCSDNFRDDIAVPDSPPPPALETATYKTVADKATQKSLQRPMSRSKGKIQ